MLPKEHEIKNKNEDCHPQIPELQPGFRWPSAAQTNIGLRYGRLVAVPTNLCRKRSAFAPHAQRPVKMAIEPIITAIPSMPSKDSNNP